ncbi:MAG TPA: exodeoxyribonuclease VII large subunit [Candidatus Krumholzibacteria bacterium]|nr:exodeoxyribonuclease VII large subunit [Candidatus Krumholzibacteria bacterium]HPD71142.1 exodeoxyribonuclease VII large subunit [Candidatus Krumholzibacteria bacterium]HRY39158.1 exodeoxyribonuclease VII large subunit [Candidatus Krumholzibacteria bacterium]
MTTPDRRILSVRQLNEAIQTALQTSFPEPLWVKGEVQRLGPDAARRKHVYFELHEGGAGGAASFQIPAAILGWDRDRFGLARYLDGSDPLLRLQDQLEVCLLCRVDFYPPYGKISLKVVGIDPEYSLGQLERRRRQVLAWLEAQGLLALNQTRVLADLPLRVGLVTSAGSAAELDFCSGLAASRYPFAVRLADCRMQGEQTAPQISAALAHLARLDLDVIVITRGGGSRADLSWFDQQDLCVAIARCPLPVVTAIGHEIDTSLADLCAHTRARTPTAAAEFLVERVRAADERLDDATERLAAAAVGRLRETSRWLQLAVGRLAGGVRGRSAAARARTDYLASRLRREAPRRLQDCRARLELQSERIRLLDPRRLLERGFTLTLDAGGRLVRRAADVRPRQSLRTRFADGEVTSVVRKGGRGGGKEDPDQQALF